MSDGGPVRLIARLPVDYAPEAALSESALLEQRFSVASAQAELLDIVQEAAGLEVAQTFESLPLVVIEASDPDTLAGLEESGVTWVVDELAEPYLLDTIGLIRGTDVHAGGVTGAGQVVAVLDTGVDTAHPFVAGRTVSQACFSTTSAANGGSTSFCPDGSNTQLGGNAGQSCDPGVAGCDHGTHVAGIAVGDGPSFTGVAPAAGLVPIQVFTRFNSAATCSPRPAPCALSYTSDQIRALEHVQDLAGTFDIAAVNMSLGGGRFTENCDEDVRKPIIDTLLALDIATVIASGNSGFSDAVGAPACISTAVTVGSTTKGDELSGFSNSAELVDILAPGSTINSSVPGGGFGFKSGTSMATPHVAGAFAVAFSAASGADVEDVLTVLQANGIPVTGRGVTKSRLDLNYLVPPAGGGAGPLAFGTVYFDGSKRSGTPNWTSSYNPTQQRYEIEIAGETYFYLDYATIVTPAGDVRICRSSSVSGRLLVYCTDASGQPATSRFGFVTYSQ